jgi:hypothetical protein
MLRIIHSLLLLAISVCSMASVIWLLSFMGFELLLFAGLCSSINTEVGSNEQIFGADKQVPGPGPSD